MESAVRPSHFFPKGRDTRERLIVALDVSSAKAAREIVAAVGDSASFYKVGMQLYTAEGPRIVRDLVGSGRRVFLDLKFHDIPNTVAAAVGEASKLGVSMLTIHAAGGGRMMRAAAEAGAANSALAVLAVTILTSMNENDLAELGIHGSVVEQVLRTGALALESGCHGLVASAQEATALRRDLGDEFVIVTPGVRPAGSGHGDQVRVVTPAQAIAAGASYIVVGRPITEAPDPGTAARSITAQMAEQ